MGETLKVDVADGTVQKLDRLGELTRRSRASVAAAALEAYADEQLSMLEGIARGVDDVKAGRVVTHDEAMHRLRRTIRSSQPE